jgi:stage II sporulation protein D
VCLVLAIWIVGVGAPAETRAAADGPSIRVLLLDQQKAVEVGGRSVRREKRFAAPGPHEVEGRRVRGAVEISRGPDGLRVVNEVPLEDYVAGSVLGEVSETWGDALLRAQAVAIRTYALHRRATAGARGYDVEADTRALVYIGLDGETPAVRDAVRATRDQVLTYDGEPILAAFHSTAGGHTASAAEVWGRDVPYLRGVRVPGEDVSPDTYWRVRLSPDALRDALGERGRGLGLPRRVTVVERSASGRAISVEIADRRESVVVSGEVLRRAIGGERLHSTLFDVRRSGDDFVFVGSGRGHGVGMSQWGARALANQGASYAQILTRFYPGARLERVTARSFAAPVGAAP